MEAMDLKRNASPWKTIQNTALANTAHKFWFSKFVLPAPFTRHIIQYGISKSCQTQHYHDAGHFKESVKKTPTCIVQAVLAQLKPHYTHTLHKKQKHSLMCDVPAQGCSHTYAGILIKRQEETNYCWWHLSNVLAKSSNSGCMASGFPGRAWSGKGSNEGSKFRIPARSGSKSPVISDTISLGGSP